MLKKYTESWTIPEYLEMIRAKKELDEIDISYDKISAMFLGTVLYCNNVYAVPSGGMKGIDKFGMRVLSILRSVGYWVCLLMCIKEIIQSATSGGDTKDILKIIIKYVIIFGSLYLVPEIFDMIPQSMN